MRGRARVGARAVTGTLVAVALLGAAAHSPAPADAATNPDTPATDAYLEAAYRLNLALQQDQHKTAASVRTTAEAIGRECHGLLAKAPGNEGESGFGADETRLTARQRGEAQRGSLQASVIQSELAAALEHAYQAPAAPAIRAFASRVDGLSWSDARIAPLVTARVTRLLESIDPPPDACGDLRLWAQSGFSALSAASRAFNAAQEGRAPTEVAASSPIGPLLAPSEGPRARTILVKLKRLDATLDSIDPIASVRPALRKALGEPESWSERREHAPVIGSGTTHAGTHFVVRKQVPEGPFKPPCRNALEVAFTRASGGSSTGGICASRAGREQPSTSCGAGEWSIQLVVKASVAAVRLQLSNHRTIVSRPVRVPPRYGGPAGIYVQSLKEPGPRAVALTELDANGRKVRALAIAKMPECEAIERNSTGPTFETLTTLTTPQGEPVRIEGVLERFGKGEQSFSLGGFSTSQNEFTAEGKPEPPKAYEYRLASECPPKAYTIIYGILAPPGATVSARNAEGLVQLAETPIPAGDGAAGPLVYGVFPTAPTELVVRRADGSTLYSESLATKNREDTEYCEGYEEPGGTLPPGPR